MLGSLLGVAGSLIGGLFGKSEADQQMKEQRKYAQNAIRWRAADARAAGIHPLAALGASSPNYTPVNSGLGSAIGDGLANLGNAVGDTAPRQQKAITASIVGKNNAEAELARAQSRTLIHRASQVPLTGTAGGTNLGDVAPEGNNFGPRAGKSKNSMFQEWTGPDGKSPVVILNPDLMGDPFEIIGGASADKWSKVGHQLRPNVEELSRIIEWANENTPEKFGRRYGEPVNKWLRDLSRARVMYPPLRGRSPTHRSRLPKARGS